MADNSPPTLSCQSWAQVSIMFHPMFIPSSNVWKLKSMTRDVRTERKRFSMFCFGVFVWQKNTHWPLNLGDVVSQQGVALQLAHLHLCLQSGRTLDGCHQEEGSSLPTRALYTEVAFPMSADQPEAQCVAQHTGHWHSEEDAGRWRVGHHRQEMEGDGVWHLGAVFVSHHAWVPLTAPTGGQKT